MQSSRRASQGFTLVELMIALAVLAVLAGIALPAYRELIAEQRNRSVANELHSALALARSEAVKRNVNITLVPMPTWTEGWRIASPIAGQADLLSQAQPAGVTIDSAAAGITFTPSGRTTGAATFELTSDTDTTAVRCLNLGVDGRASVDKGEC